MELIHHKLTRAALAEEAGIAPSTLSRLLRHGTIPGRATAAALAAAAGGVITEAELVAEALAARVGRC